MRTKMAPIYTTLTLAYLEENLYKIIGENIATKKKPRFYSIIEKITGWLFHIL